MQFALVPLGLLLQQFAARPPGREGAVTLAILVDGDGKRLAPIGMRLGDGLRGQGGDS